MHFVSNQTTASNTTSMVQPFPGDLSSIAITPMDEAPLIENHDVDTAALFMGRTKMPCRSSSHSLFYRTSRWERFGCRSKFNRAFVVHSNSTIPVEEQPAQSTFST